MTPVDTRPGMIARIGLGCARHRWWVLAAWLIIGATGFLASGRVFDGLSNQPGATSLESVQGADLIDAQSQVGDTVLGELTGVDPKAAAVQAAVRATAADIATIPGVRSVATPYDAGAPPAQAAALLAHDGRGLLIDVALTKNTDNSAGDPVDAVTSRLDKLQATLRAGPAGPGAAVLAGGGGVLHQQVNHQVQSDLGKAEGLSLPITLVVLIFVFGGIIAAGLPILAAILSVFAAFAALLGFQQITDLDQNATIVVTLLGLGLSIDYGLLLVARYREELGRGHGPERALANAWTSAGRTVVFSALTVAGSLLGLVAYGVTSMTALGVAGVSIATIAMLAALTSTAALLGVARKRIRPSRRAAARAALDEDAQVGFFARLARLVQRRPAIVAALTAGLLLAAGLPLLDTKPRINNLASLPTSMSSVQVAHDLTDRFGTTEEPAVRVVARTDPAALSAWSTRWAQAPGVLHVAPASQLGDGLSMVDVYLSGDPEGGTARDLVHQIRADRPAGVRSWVTGEAALLDDLLGLIGDRLPWAIGITVLAMMVLLFLMTGSLVVPLKAIVMNAVSLGATVGVMNLVFQHGYGSSLLHTLTTGALDPFVIVGVLAFAFGLSMDYEVFLLSRIKEYFDHGDPTEVAVRRGLQRSGRVITSAALLMVIVFGCFLVGRTGNTQQIGLGLAAAIAIDATLVRCVLVPATMTLLGKWNWWAPAPLARWHRKWMAPALVEAPPQRAPEPVGVSV